MQRNEYDFQRAKELSGSAQARQLMELLRRSDPQQLQKVLESAAKGDFRQAQETLAPLMQNPQVQNLLKELGERHG